MPATEAHPATETLRFERRFQGFANGALGGYVAGAVAERIDGPAEVNLRSLPPMDRELALRESGEEGELVLAAGEIVVADARPAGFELEVPAPPSLEEAAAASAHPIHEEAGHPYPGCFACGPGREAGDALRLFMGRRSPGSSELVAAWTPDEALGGHAGELTTAMVWAALDCPTIWAAWATSEPAAHPEHTLTVLARQRVEILAPVPAGEPAIVGAWEAEHSGRKHLCGAAIHTAAGELLVRADSLLIDVPRPTA